ncbi:hypothetical protein GIR22_05990 [Pseudomonas sp. CCM 7891]|uniref:DUF3021 domain-containing protein n=1 Tax=Pseudomonas karstica TaxID=1055468 RepID=A0A7X2RRR9_9PSED|nr:hypothetical protein [Pseudomonas karstica]MTD18700.1 hypothetical protein [Pseudomonas karstica]
MDDLHTLRDFFRQSFLTFLVGIFAAYCSLAFATALAFVTYFCDASIGDGTGVSIFLAGALLVLLTVHSNFMILRGRPLWVWVWVMVMIYLGCFLFVLSMIQLHTHRIVYWLALVFPLFGLLTVNSVGQRKMRETLVKIRHLRQAAIAEHKSR